MLHSAEEEELIKKTRANEKAELGTGNCCKYCHKRKIVKPDGIKDWKHIYKE
jgi:hypothetical protein